MERGEERVSILLKAATPGVGETFTPGVKLITKSDPTTKDWVTERELRAVVPVTYKFSSASSLRAAEPVEVEGVQF